MSYLCFPRSFEILQISQKASLLFLLSVRLKTPHFLVYHHLPQKRPLCPSYGLRCPSFDPFPHCYFSWYTETRIHNWKIHMVTFATEVRIFSVWAFDACWGGQENTLDLKLQNSKLLSPPLTEGPGSPMHFSHSILKSSDCSFRCCCIYKYEGRNFSNT